MEQDLSLFTKETYIKPTYCVYSDEADNEFRLLITIAIRCHGSIWELMSLFW